MGTLCWVAELTGGRWDGRRLYVGRSDSRGTSCWEVGWQGNFILRGGDGRGTS